MRLAWMRFLLLMSAAGASFCGLAAAHGAPPPREIDLRILTDTTDQGDYGTAAPLLYEGGHDLLALDLREGYSTELREPVLILRLIQQAGDPTQGALREVVTFNHGGVLHTFDFLTTDNVVYTTTTFHRIDTIDVGDEFVTGAEGWVPFSAIGMQAGDNLTDLRVRGFVGEKRADEMPGLYWYQGQPVAVDTATDAPSYTLAGPAQLLSAGHDLVAAEWLQKGRAAEVNVTVVNPLTGLSQLVTVRVEQPADANVLPETLTLLLGPGETRRGAFTVDGAAALVGAGLDWEVSSDLLAWSPLAAPVPWADVLPTLAADPDGAFGWAGGQAPLQPGEWYTYTFASPGDFDYNSTLDPSLYGQVAVRDEPAAADEPPRLVFIDTDPDGVLAIHDRQTGGRFTRVPNGTTVAWVNRADVPVDLWSQAAFQGPAAGQEGAPFPGLVFAFGTTVFTLGVLGRARRL